MESKKGLNFSEALEALNDGKKIKVPEWKGYWFKQSGMIKVMTAEGVVLETPHFQQYIFRTDWEIVQEKKANEESYIVAISSFIDNEIIQFHVRAENGYEALKKATLEFEGGGIYNSHLVAMQSNNDFPSTLEELTAWLKKYKYSSSVFQLHSFKKNN